MTRLYMTLAALGLSLVACRKAAPIHENAIALNTRCANYLEAGDDDKAEHMCDLALEYNPDYPEPYNQKCLIEIHRAHFDRAKDLCIKAIRLNNDFAEAYNNLGFVYRAEGSLGKAYDAFKQALKINPGYADARYNLANTLILIAEKERSADRKGKYIKESRTEYDKLVELFPNLPLPWADLCYLDISEGYLDDAIQRCTKATQLNPKFANAWLLLGEANMKAGKQCDAKDAFDECVKVEESNAECRNNIAVAARYCALQSPEINAVKAKASEEESANAYYTSGVAQKDKGLLSEAARDFKKCVKADGTFGLCYCQLADLAKQEARGKDVKDYCKKCVRHTSSEQSSAERDMCEKYLTPEGE